MPMQLTSCLKLSMNFASFVLSSKIPPILMHSTDSLTLTDGAPLSLRRRRRRGARCPPPPSMSVDGVWAKRWTRSAGRSALGTVRPPQRMTTTIVSRRAIANVPTAIILLSLPLPPLVLLLLRFDKRPSYDDRSTRKQPYAGPLLRTTLTVRRQSSFAAQQRSQTRCVFFYLIKI